MKILWIEDFGGQLSSSQLIVEMFSKLVPEIRTELDPDDCDISNQFAIIFKKHTSHQIYLCRSYMEWKRIYEQHAGHFDLALIDINLEAYPTPHDELPEGVDPRRFDGIAGFYIYHQLVKRGFQDDNIAFITDEELLLREFNRHCGEILLGKPKYTFEKTPQDLKELGDWILQKLTGTNTVSGQYRSTKENADRKIFISYAKEDIEKAYDIYKTLKQRGYNPWIDEERIVAGQDWMFEIERAIQESVLFIACLSSNSVTKEGYFQKELKKAVDILDRKPEGSLYFIPVRFDNCTVPTRFQQIHWCDLFRFNGIEKLLKAVETVFNSKLHNKPKQA